MRAGQTAFWFCAGTVGAALLPSLPGAGPLVALGLVAAGLLFFDRLRPLAGLPLGIFWFCIHAVAFEAEAWPDHRAHETVVFDARVASLPEQRDGRARVEFELEPASRGAGLPSRVLLSWYRPLEWFRPGERWRVHARLEPLHGRVNPGLFDYHRYLLARGIGALGRIERAERLATGDWRSAPDRFRQRFADWLQAETVDLDAAALHRALTVGDRSAMSPELSKSLRRTGTAHLLSISGLHVGMVAALAGLAAGVLVTPVVRLLGGIGRRRVMLAAGLLAAFGYSALAGFSLPTVRALVMLGAGFGAMLWRRGIQPGRALLAALFAVLLLDPAAPLAIGFWLSFGAVAVLIWSFAGRARGGSRFTNLVRAQVVVAIGLLPLNIGLFGQWAPTALAANLVAIPLIGTWVLPCLLAVLFLFAFGLPADALLAASEQGLALFLALLDVLAPVDAMLGPLGLPARPPPGVVEIALAAVGALWLLAPAGWPMRPAGLVLLMPLVWPDASLPAHGEFDVRVPDLGDGQAVIVTTATRTWLYGTGPGDGAERSLVPGTLAPMIRQAGFRHVDRIIVPYAHRDFSGGLSAARREWPDADVIAPGAGCETGRAWKIDGVRFRVLHPSPALPDLGGDSSCVLEIASPAGRVLLTGGIGEIVGARLLKDGPDPVDAIVLPRAGRADAIHAPWLHALEPRIAVVTAGAYNRRGLPEPETRAMVRRAGARLLVTGECGAVRLRFRNGTAGGVSAHGVSNPRFWRDARDCGATHP